MFSYLFYTLANTIYANNTRNQFKNFSFSNFNFFLQKYQEFNGGEMYRKLIKLTYFNISRSVEKSKHLSLGLFVCKNAFPEQISEKVSFTSIRYHNIILVDSKK